ncbi:asparagine synthase (glutamine-hydrolyzing) [Magnetospira sp. QH-2]|uniref:asparagine synthase (glutamine-hydrolyzing) n=1 Tax=Magnetospira sp. (strain QH-2) TaxID=1288970 RepID=UPI0003E8155F|nr:asparagine synthase (glutamine-hydrolyzing) [Magnetospira sp. QH-2]CCQ75472.1 putative Asparagine synthetase [glutamine-hydrolyzing] [Magnetospira sp. QH-2]
MCGIAGLFLPRDAAPISADLSAMARVMAHRGPDGEAEHVSEDRRFQAVFRRLAIIDLHTGDQPIVENGGQRVLLGNGEIYNYRELRGAEPDYPYRTQGDMEVVLPLAAHLGEEFVHQLNGMYGLALYERDPHQLLLVRDRLGIKPLYWARTSGKGLLFASEIKSLFASGLIERRIDEQAVSAYLAHGWVPGPETLYTGVHKLQPGHLLRAGADGSVTIERYWRPRAAFDLPEDPQEIETHLIDLLRDSVRLQLRSDVPVGALLSGGLDSGLMVALAAEQSVQPVNTFTVRFPGARYDEAPLAQAVADRYGTNHQMVEVDARDAGRLLPKLAWHCEEPLFDAALLPNFLIEQALGEHVTVALNGSGGDELFAGYGRYFPLPVEQRYLKIPALLRRGLIEPLAPAMTAFQLRRAEKFSRDRAGYLHDHTGHFPDPIRRLIGNRLVSPPAAQTAPYQEFDGPPQSAALAADLQTYLADDLMVLLDRTAMAVGVEGRVPFLDHRLVEAALAVPPTIRTPGGEQKALERRMAARYLPEALLKAPKQGFASPVPAWLKAGLADPIRRLLTRPETLERGWWSAEGITRLMAEPERHGFRVYTLAMLELTVRMHGESDTIEDLNDV